MRASPHIYSLPGPRRFAPRLARSQLWSSSRPVAVPVPSPGVTPRHCGLPIYAIAVLQTAESCDRPNRRCANEGAAALLWRPTAQVGALLRHAALAHAAAQPTNVRHTVSSPLAKIH